MKTKTLNFLAVIAAVSVTLYSCAGTDNANDTTAMDDNVTMSETQTMAGETADDADAVVVTTEVVAPVATIPIAALSLENTEEINDMFDDITDTESMALMDLARKSPNLSTFVQLMDASGLTANLKADSRYTIFAPTNEAFSKLSKQDLEMLLLPENKAKLSAVLMTHILPSEVTASSFNSSQRIDLGNDRYIPVTTAQNGRQIIVGGATIVRPNVEASNGVIHVVDGVILPSQAAVEGNR